jgi:hypothetical protein
MKKTMKILAVALILTMLFNLTPVFAAAPEKCNITVNGQNAEWNLRPFLAYGPLGNVKIMIPMRDLFTTLGYTVSYDAKSNRSIFTADKNSNYTSFYVDVKTGQIVKEGEEVKKDTLYSAYLINDSLYVTADDYFSLDYIAKTFLNDSAVKIDYDYVYTPNEDFITDYKNYFSIKNNLTSLTIETVGKCPDRPFIGEQFTKYNTGEWVSGAEAKKNNFTGEFSELILQELWEGFDNLRFYTGKGEQNELTGKGAWNCTAYAIAWELMDAVALEINKLRKQNGLPELIIDNSLCFISVGAANPKVDSVFDNAIHNFETNRAAHTYSGKSRMAECLATGVLRGAENNTTQAIAANIVNRWYKSTRGHKEIIMGERYKTMGILVVITDTGTGDAYAVFK